MCSAMANALLIPRKSIRLSGRNTPGPCRLRTVWSIRTSDPLRLGQPETYSGIVLISLLHRSVCSRTALLSSMLRSRVVRAGSWNVESLHDSIIAHWDHEPQQQEREAPASRDPASSRGAGAPR